MMRVDGMKVICLTTVPHVRDHRRAETKYEARLKKIYCEKSAEVIVSQTTQGEGLNLKK